MTTNVHYSPSMGYFTVRPTGAGWIDSALAQTVANNPKLAANYLKSGYVTKIGAPGSGQATPQVAPQPVLPVTPIAPLAPLDGTAGAPPLGVTANQSIGNGGDFWSMLFGGFPQQQVPLNTTTNGATSPNYSSQFGQQLSYAQPVRKNPPPQGASQQVPKNPPPTGSGIQQTAAPTTNTAASTTSVPEVPLRPFG